MTVQVGVLGFAHGHVSAYCRRWSTEPELGVAVVAGWDHDAQRLDGAAQQFGLTPHATADALLADDRVEAVVVAAETAFHADLVEKAAAAGRTIILQKPMSLTMDEADRIVAAVEGAGVPFSMAWQMRVDAQNLAMREMVCSGQLGKLFMVRRRHGLSTQKMRNFTSLWHVDPAMNRDIWADDAAHPLDFLYWLLGMPESVTAEMGSFLDPRVPNDNGIAILRYPGGPIAEVCSSFVCLAHESTTEIVAEKGVVIQNYGDAPSSGAASLPGATALKWFSGERNSWEVLDVPGYASQGDRISNLAAPLAEFLHGQRPPIATAQEGRDVLRIMMACYESAETGQRINL